jgi:hypothetical protein
MEAGQSEVTIEMKKVPYIADTMLMIAITHFDSLNPALNGNAFIIDDTHIDMLLSSQIPDWYEVHLEFRSWADDVIDNGGLAMAVISGIAVATIVDQVKAYITSNPTLIALFEGTGISVASFAMGYGGALWVANHYKVIDVGEYLRDYAIDDIKHILTTPKILLTLVGVGTIGAGSRKIEELTGLKAQIQNAVTSGVGASVFYNTILQVMDNQQITFIP